MLITRRNMFINVYKWYYYTYDDNVTICWGSWTTQLLHVHFKMNQTIINTIL